MALGSELRPRQHLVPQPAPEQVLELPQLAPVPLSVSVVLPPSQQVCLSQPFCLASVAKLGVLIDDRGITNKDYTCQVSLDSELALHQLDLELPLHPLDLEVRFVITVLLY